ncbi:MAG TPA: hypothetical protein VFO35_17320 [Steroidobacteraceae bacterium]|nr:hypothetical protein [Steroidobacteraceae bacterium]
MNRRKVTASLAALLGLAGMGGNQLLPGRRNAAAADSIARRIAEVLQLDPGSVASMCTARARAQLTSHFVRCGSRVAELQQGSDTAALKRIIRERIQADYLRGDIVDIDGWQLASTEALVLALYALTPARV